jgi:hypothetical protein
LLVPCLSCLSSFSARTPRLATVASTRRINILRPPSPLCRKGRVKVLGPAEGMSSYTVVLTAVKRALTKARLYSSCATLVSQHYKTTMLAGVSHDKTVLKYLAS